MTATLMFIPGMRIEKQAESTFHLIYRNVTIAVIDGLKPGVDSVKIPQQIIQLINQE